MKKWNLLIIGMIGLALIATVGFVLFLMESNIANQQKSTISLFQKNSSGIKLTVDGLNDTYLVGQHINFNITTTSKECSRPHIMLTNKNGNVTWTERPAPMFCDARPSWSDTRNWRLTEGDLGSLTVYEKGVYKITISFLGNVIEKNLHIVTTYPLKIV